MSKKVSLFNNYHNDPVNFKKSLKEHRESKYRAYFAKKHKRKHTAVFLVDFPLLNKYLKKSGFKNYMQFLYSDAWLKFKKDFYRSNPKICDICGGGSNIQLHHIRYGNLLDIKNIKPVCGECHLQAHNYALEEGKSLKNTYHKFKEWKKTKKEVVCNSVWITDYFASL